MIAIKPTQIPLRNSEAHFIKMRAEFDLKTDNSLVQWFVYDSEQQIITNGSIDIPTEVHNEWKEDDSIIENYVLDFLQLVKL